MTRVETDDGTELFIRDVGAGDPIVLVHGWPVDHRMFEYQYEGLLDAGYRCLGVDLRGFGKSDKPYGDYSYDRFADDLKSVFEAFDIENATLVGFSMGGGVATHYMSRHDEAHVDKLALLSAASPCLTEKPDFPEGLSDDDLKPFVEGTRNDRAAINAEFGELLFHTRPSDGILNWLWGLGMEASGYATAKSGESLRDEDLRDELADITVPTKVCHGVEDEVCPFEITGRVLDEGIENTDLVRFDECGHGTFYEEKENITDEILDIAG